MRPQRRERDPGTMSSLLELGFEPLRPVPECVEDTILPSGDHKLVVDRRAMSTRVSIAAIHHSRHLLEDAAGRAYEGPGAAFFVAELGGEIVGGSGIGPLPGAEPHVCELRKMYLLVGARGRGIGRRLLEACVQTAREIGYRECYLETLAQMDRARDLYERFGFLPLEAPMGDTGHFGCNRWYSLSL